jgi:hypothetical protein
MGANWEKHQVQGYHEAGEEDSPRVVAITDIAKALHHWGYTREEAVQRIMTVISTSSRTELEYVTGVVAYVFDNA